MNGEPHEVSYEFGPFRLEPATRRLLREGEPLPLTPKAFDTLLLLVQNRERVMEKEEVLRRIWPDAVVEESNLAQNVFTLRKTLGDSPEGARFIATVPRRGYRFVARVVPMRSAASETALTAPRAVDLPPRRRSALRPAKAAAVALVAILLPIAGYLAGRRASAPASETPKLTRLTFRRGIVRGARFAADGRTVVYGASWDGEPSQVFLARPDTPESMKLGAPAAELLAVSSSSELALRLSPSRLLHKMGEFQTLARVPMTGGVPREVLEDVQFADWSPDAQSLAVVRKLENRLVRLEYPIGNVLAEGTSRRCFDRLRVSRDGALVAFVGCDKPMFSVSVVDGGGAVRRLWEGNEWVSGLAWSPGGDEVWFTTEARGQLAQARAVDLSARTRLLAPVPGALSDVSPSGAALVVSGRHRSGIRGQAPGENTERELSWLEGSAAVDLSADGDRVLFGEQMEGGGVSGRIYLRRTDGSPAVHLGDGYPLGLSPDGRWAAVRLHGRDGLTFLPTGAGETRTVPTGAINVYLAHWFPVGGRLLVGGIVAEREGRLYVFDPNGSSLRAITPEMTGIGTVSPDGHWIATIGHDGHFLYPVDGGERRPIPGLDQNDWPVGWSADGKSLYIRREGEMPLPVMRVDVNTGHRQAWKEFLPPDAAGVVWIDPLVTPDGRGYVYTYHRVLSDLYLVEGLK